MQDAHSFTGALPHTRTPTLPRRSSLPGPTGALTATALLLTNLLAGAHRRSRPLLLDRCRLHAHLNVRGHGVERLLYVRRVLSRRLQELDTERFRELLRLLSLDRALRFQVALVSHQQLVHVLARVAVDFVEPLLHIVERLRVGHIVHHNNAMGAPVVTAGDGPEPLLARCVPDLQFDGLPFEVDGADFEVNADRGDVRFSVSILCEA
mmetsp:Transcript_23217/g.52355  ORF Transcript_23217/g.52355 Transcript_23217/m.52355 type:complete len:208 (-) Transcript_23217:167-790(-)